MTPDMLLTVSGVFVMTGVLAAWGAAAWLTARSTARQRLRAVVAQGAPTGSAATAGGLTDTLDPALARVSKMMPRSADDMSRLQKRLSRAGFRGPRAALYYSLAEIALPLASSAAVLLKLGTTRNGIIAAACAAALAALVPQLFVDHRLHVRQKLLSHGIPDALDLMTLCVEAGNGLDQAIGKTSEEIRIAHPDLADELRLVITEIRAGKPRLDAFRNFADRTGLDEIRGLSSMLMQTDRFGTSIGQALRTHADTSRTERRQAAEERAGRVSVKLVFPLALCLFPALYVVCFGPVVVRIVHAFF